MRTMSNPNSLIKSFFVEACTRSKQIPITLTNDDRITVREILTNIRHEDCDGESIADTLYAFALLCGSWDDIEEFAKAIFDKIYDHRKNFSPDGLKKLLFALNILGLEWKEVKAEGLEQALADSLYTHAKNNKLNQKDISSIISTLSSFRLTWSEVQKLGLNQVLLYSIDNNFDYFVEAQLSMVMLGLAHMGISREELNENYFIENVIKAIKTHVQRFPRRTTSNILWSLAHFGLTWNELEQIDLARLLLEAIERDFGKDEPCAIEEARQIKQAQAWFDFVLPKEIDERLTEFVKSQPKPKSSNTHLKFVTEIKKYTEAPLEIEARIHDLYDVDILLHGNVIEVDGPKHNEALDKFKTTILYKWGYKDKVFRVNTDDIYHNRIDIPAYLQSIGVPLNNHERTGSVVKQTPQLQVEKSNTAVGPRQPAVNAWAKGNPIVSSHPPQKQELIAPLVSKPAVFSLEPPHLSSVPVKEPSVRTWPKAKETSPRIEEAYLETFPTLADSMETKKNNKLTSFSDESLPKPFEQQATKKVKESRFDKTQNAPLNLANTEKNTISLNISLNADLPTNIGLTQPSTVSCSVKQEKMQAEIKISDTKSLPALPQNTAVQINYANLSAPTQSTTLQINISLNGGATANSALSGGETVTEQKQASSEASAEPQEQGTKKKKKNKKKVKKDKTKAEPTLQLNEQVAVTSVVKPTQLSHCRTVTFFVAAATTAATVAGVTFYHQMTRN